MALYNSKQEFLEKAPSHLVMKYLQSYQPDVFLCADRIGYVQAWEYGNIFWLYCNGVNGESFTGKFQGVDMISTAESYFSALRAGYPLWDV